MIKKKRMRYYGYTYMRHDFFEFKEIKLLSNMECGDETIILYLHFLTKSLKSDHFLSTMIGNYDNKNNLHSFFRIDKSLFDVCLKNLKSLGIIEEYPNGFLVNEIRADRARTDAKYKQWRRSVFERDDYTCQDCDVRGVSIHAHHKKEWSKYIECRYEVDNGLTLCIPCHKKRHRGRGGKFNGRHKMD